MTLLTSLAVVGLVLATLVAPRVAEWWRGRQHRRAVVNRCGRINIVVRPHLITDEHDGRQTRPDPSPVPRTLRKKESIQ